MSAAILPQQMQEHSTRAKTGRIAGRSLISEGVALPSEGGEPSDLNKLGGNLGANSSIDPQGVSATPPKLSGRAVQRLAVTHGRELLGYILETSDGLHRAVNADDEFVGDFSSRLAASRALSPAATPIMEAAAR